MQNRIGSCVRNTKETQIELEINLDGSGEAAESRFLIIC